MKTSGQPIRHILATALLLLVPLLACGGSDATLPTFVPTANPDAQSAATTSSDPPAAPDPTAEAPAADAGTLHAQSAPATSSDPPTASAPTAEAPAADAGTLHAQMGEALREFDYEQQQLLVTGVEMRGEELVVSIKRVGSPSMNDYFGQLGIIHAVVAENEPDATAVRTLDVDAENGFVVAIDDLLDYYHGRLDFETYRRRWRFFEP